MESKHCKCMLGSVMDLYRSDVAHSCGECLAGGIPVQAAIRRTQAVARRRLGIGARLIKNNLND